MEWRRHESREKSLAGLNPSGTVWILRFRATALSVPDSLRSIADKWHSVSDRSRVSLRLLAHTLAHQFHPAI
jgi:hypothetical protein